MACVLTSKHEPPAEKDMSPWCNGELDHRRCLCHLEWSPPAGKVELHGAPRCLRDVGAELRRQPSKHYRLPWSWGEHLKLIVASILKPCTRHRQVLDFRRDFVLVKLSEGSRLPNMVTKVLAVNPDITSPGNYIKRRTVAYLGSGLRVSMMSGVEGRPGRRSELSGAEHWSCRPLAGPARPVVV